MLAVLRCLFIFIYFIVINLLLILVCLVRPFHRNNVYLAGQVYGSVSRLIGVKVKLRVAPEIKANQPYVFIANHQNSYDIFTICKAALPGVVTVGKKSLKWIPIFGQLYWLSGNIMIDRKNSGKARDTLSQTAEKIRERKLSVWFFPEGTRSYGRGLLPFKTGAFRLAQDTQTPLALVCASNTHRNIKLNRWDNGTVLIDILPPQVIDDSHSAKAWAEICHQQMQTHLQKLTDEVALLDAKE
ncbi:1-acylglycerol-3-phosphate O-acyltransferase [Alteromonas flava]|uniref:1-acylglycerol-3-phosphate O-acyltransferase n=1 Tax=Alteromonas flava TaxID=2048003 RepID=UPI000C294831|nr:1-acylglycerol-3-phosphate O-acyltransferase [Alteromonas flava]